MAKILIVEDDPLIVKIYTTRLVADGHQVESSDNGIDGIKKISEFTPDVILLDLMMPKMDGFDFLDQVRKQEKHKNTPILIYSNLSNEEEVNRAKSLGATEFLVKANLTPPQVVETIKKYLPRTIKTETQSGFTGQTKYDSARDIKRNSS